MKLIKLLLALSIFLSVSFGFEKASQKGVGTIDMYNAHGLMVYRFVPKEPNTQKLRLVKFKPSLIGYKKGLPEELETFLANAVKEKLEVEIACDFLDKGAGKKTSIGKKIISYKLAE